MEEQRRRIDQVHTAVVTFREYVSVEFNRTVTLRLEPTNSQTADRAPARLLAIRLRRRGSKQFVNEVTCPTTNVVTGPAA